jgi:glucokinase
MAAKLGAVRDRTPTIVAAALDPQHPDPLCKEVLALFVSFLGAAAGNLALTVLATGGVYIAGGIPQRILPDATDEWQRMLSRFEDKGRLSPMLARVPVHVVLEPVALLGAAIHGLDIVSSPGRVGA